MIQKFGGAYTLWFGPFPVVNICDWQVANDVMVRNGSLFIDRWIPYLFNVVRKGNGLIASSGESWAEQRKFAINTLRSFGVGRNLMQDRIIDEFNYRKSLLDKEMEKSGGELAMDPHNFIDFVVVNIINVFLFSERFTEEREARFFKLKKELDKMMEDFSPFDMAINETTAKLPILMERARKIAEPVERVAEFIKEQVEQRKRDISSGKHHLREDSHEDYVDAFLFEMEKGSLKSFNDDMLVISLLDLWVAGQETTTTTLYWAFNYLIQHPHYLRRLQKELDDVTRGERQLTLNDKPQTPFLNCVITEVLRLSAIFPLNLWRQAGKDTTVIGHPVPEGTAVTVQMSVVMKDDTVFNKVTQFNPERFLNSNLEQHVIPFGIGKRACLGESLARAELYLIIGNMVLSYEMKADPLHPPKMEAISEGGSFRRPNSYKIVYSMR